MTIAETWAKEAFTHPCVGRKNFQRLELLGDRVLNMVVMELLFHKYTDEDEGMLSRRLATLVSGDTCARVARKLGFQHKVNTNGDVKLANSDKTLANVMEAYIGALYVQHGFTRAHAFVAKLWYPLLEGAGAKDPKTELQELLQGENMPRPVYELFEKTGPDHDPKFTVTIHIGSLQYPCGTGRSRKEAEQNAAAVALTRIRRS